MNRLSSKHTSPLKKSLQRHRSQKKWTEDEVSNYLEEVFTSGDQDPARAIRLVLDECAGEEKEPCRKALFEACICALNLNHLHTQVAKEVIGKLLFEVETLSGASQVELAEVVIKGLKEGHHAALELFPKLLACIASHKSIRYQKPEGGSGEMMGEDHKSHLINSLFGCRWDSSCVLHVTDTCKEIPMTDDELKFLIQKVFQMLESLDVTEIPPLVYQLLSLSRKGHRTLVLEGIKALFDKLDKTITQQEEETDSVTSSSWKDLLTTEGTVFVHVTFAIKQDPNLRKEFLKILKSVQGRLSSSELTLFFVSLVLSAVCIHRLEDTVYGFFKDVVLKAYKDEERTNSSQWLQEVTEDAVDIENLLMSAVSRSTSGWDQVVHGSGWDQVVQGLVSVGLHLMENFGPKSSTLSQFGTPQRKACALGSKMISETFKKHGVVHRDVVTQIVNRVMANADTHVTHYVDLLSRLMRGTSPMDLTDSLLKLKESLSYIALIPSHAAVPLLTAILPLVQFSPSLRDCLLLVLRKSLFSRQVDARKTAVEGYLLLLRKFTVLDSVGSLTDSELSMSSQVSVEIHGRSHHGNQALCLEILGTLRRALTKQYDVKLSLYEGLYPVFCANTKLAEPILDLLIGHFIKFYEHEAGITPPIKLNPCIKMSDSDVSGTEPLDYLVRCIQLCICHYLDKQDDSSEEPPAIIEEAQQMLTSLVERMIASELEDFELNRSSDFSTSSVGQKNRLIAQFTMGTYETLLDYTFCSGQFCQASAEQVLKLHKGYQNLADILQDNRSSGGGASSSHSNKRGAGPVQSRLSLHCVVLMLKTIFNDQTPNHQQGLTTLRDSQTFIKYVLGVALQKIHQVHDSGSCDGSFAEHKPDYIFKQFCYLARVMFKHIELGGARTAKKEKGKSVAMYCLEGFSLLLQTAIVRWERGGGFLTAVNPSLDESSSPNERVHYFIRHLQRLVCGVLDGSCKEWSLKEAQLMVNDIERLTGMLELGSQELSLVFDWTYAQCQHHNVDDPPLTKALISLLLVAGERHKNSVKTIRKLAQDVHYHLGDIDEDIELEATPNFSIVNPRTSSSCILGLLFTHVDQVLNGVDWLVGRLKVEAASPFEDNFGRPGTQVSTQSRDLCAAICERLTHVVVTGSELVQSSVGVNTTEGVLKMMYKVFSTLGNLAKYVLDIYQHTSSVPVQFKKLVSLVGTELSQQVYLFLTFIQKLNKSSGSLESDRGKKGGRGKTKTATSGKSSIRKESRSFSNLIFFMEQFEKHLILLDKKAKGHLMEPFKHSMSRDFRIDAQAVGNILDEDEPSSEGEGEEEGNPPEAKRIKSA